MSDSKSEETQPSVKVRDRRRFSPDGTPREESSGEQAAVTLEQAQASSQELDRMTAELDAARRRVDELARAYQAVEREKEDFKARLKAERDLLIDVERGAVAVTLLEAIDDLDLCLGAADPTSSLAKGVKLIRDGILKKLEATGVQRLELAGRPFDPAQAEASDVELTARQEEDGQVSAELRAGYRLKDRVIRPARVRVLRYVKPAQA